MSCDALIEKLVDSPRLGLYVDRLQHVLNCERRRREQFYQSMTEGSKQEFINGEVVVHSPVKLKHDLLSGLTDRLVSTYADRHDVGKTGHEKLLVCLSRNDYEPDVCFFSKEKAVGFT